MIPTKSLSISAAAVITGLLTVYILDQFDRVRHVLSGVFSRRDLERSARLVKKEMLKVKDPKLFETLDQIELRAQLELTKYSTLD